VTQDLFFFFLTFFFPNFVTFFGPSSRRSILSTSKVFSEGFPCCFFFFKCFNKCVFSPPAYLFSLLLFHIQGSYLLLNALKHPIVPPPLSPQHFNFGPILINNYGKSFVSRVFPLSQGRRDHIPSRQLSFLFFGLSSYLFLERCLGPFCSFAYNLITSLGLSIQADTSIFSLP